MIVRLTWTAGPDSIGHVRIGTTLRTACGRVPTAESLSWGIDSRCLVCATAAEAASPRLCPRCRDQLREEVHAAHA